MIPMAVKSPYSIKTRATALCVGAVCLVVISTAAFAAPLELGRRRELFVDDYLIDALRGAARLRLHAPTRREIALVHDRPWEGSGCGFHTVFRDGDKFRMYYKSWQILGAQRHPVMIAYAESRDGVHWIKPNLGLHEFQGSTDNNLILTQFHGAAAHDFSVFLDENPQTSAEEKYKAVGVGQNPYGIYAFTSPDGLRFTPRKAPVFTGGRIDSQNVAFWDPNVQRYRLYLRDAQPYSPPKRGRYRSVRVADSENFQAFRQAEPLTFPAAPEEELYTNNVRPYYRAPHLYLGFPARYIEREWSASTAELPERGEREERAKIAPRYGAAVSDALLITSRDGRTFRRWDEAFLRPGLRTRHNWSYGDNFFAWGILETKSTFDDAPAEMSLYAVESYFTGESSRLRRYTLRIDGFASVFAPLGGGEVITKPLVFSGRELVLNYSTSAGGELRVELQDAEGRPLPSWDLNACDVIFGDQLERVVTWKQHRDLSALAGRPVRLRLVLKDADVFSLQFR